LAVNALQSLKSAFGLYAITRFITCRPESKHLVQRGNTKHGGQVVDGESRLSATEHRSRAARFRVLAAAATTARSKEYLLGMANQHDALAEGRIEIVPPTFDDAADKTALRGSFR
jgi:hypothetical protein